MRKTLLLLLLAIPCLGSIAFDSYGGPTADGSYTNNALDYTHTVGSGSNRVALVYVWAESGCGDCVNGVSFGGVWMTRIKYWAAGGSGAWIYGLIAPATGANTVHVSYTLNYYGTGISSVVYTGAYQSSLPTNVVTGTLGPGTSFSPSLTTGADKSWVLSFAQTAYPISAGSATALRVRWSFLTWGAFDSNAAVSPAASRALNITTTGSSVMQYALLELGQASPAGSGRPIIF